MLYYLKHLARRLFPSGIVPAPEVERISALQQIAVKRRAEYRQEKQNASVARDERSTTSFSEGRKRMEEAEAAHIVALQRWENKQARQNSF